MVNVKRLVGILVLVIIILSLGLGIPLFEGLGKSGFLLESIQMMWFWYSIPLLGFTILILAAATIEALVTKGDDLYGNSLLFFSPGEFPSPQFNFLKNTGKIILLTIIFTLGLSLFSSITNTSFGGIGSLEQQFTVMDNTIFRAGLIPISENLIPAGFVALFLVLFRILARKIKLNKILFSLFAVTISVLIYLSVGIIIHLMRYSASDAALLSVGIFWFLGGLITVLSGSIISFWIMHTGNNLFLDLAEHFGNDSVFIGTILALVFLVILYVMLYIRGGKKVQNVQ